MKATSMFTLPFLLMAACTWVGPEAQRSSTAVGNADASFRKRDEALYGKLAAAEARCGSDWAPNAECLALLRQLREAELELYADVRSHRFRDVTESNYWHRGRLKFPSRIDQLVQRLQIDLTRQDSLNRSQP